MTLTKRFNSQGLLCNDNVHIYLMILPTVVLLFFASVYPLLWALRYMFFAFDGMRDPRFIGLDNFVRIFTRDKEYWNSVLNTFIYAGGKLIITVPLSFILAVILNTKLRGRNIFRIVFFLPTIISISVMSLIFYFIFNTYNGIINQLLLRFGMISDPIEWLGMKWAMPTSILVASWGAVGNYMIYFLAGLQAIPEELYESASLDGARSFQLLRYITIPMMGPVMQVVLMLAILVSLRGYESIMILTAGGPNGVTDVMYLYIFKTFFPMAESVGDNFISQYGYGSAISFVSSLIIGAITAFYLWWSKKMNKIY